MKEALIIVDVQNDYFPGGRFPTDSPVETAQAIAQLMEKFRKENKEIVHVVHHATEEQRKKLNFFEPGTSGVEIHESVKPLANEKIFIKHEMSSFVGTDLKEYLESKGIDTIIVVGMMIHNCVNATVYSGTHRGFKCIVVDEAVNTFDQPYDGRIIKAKQIKEGFLAGIEFVYAKVKKVDDILNNNY
jgi:nicotinamidase-related amidase